MSAICSAILGIYMLATFPVSARWVPGALMGLEFVITGTTLVGLSLNLKKLKSEHRETKPNPIEKAA